jgi:hypothetical protein
MTLTQEQEVVEVQERVLKVNDRCDACGSQAFVQVKLLNGELLFCGHHYNKYQNKLNHASYSIVDERDYINANPSQSSN